MCLALQPCHNAFHRKPEATKPFLTALAHSETFSQGQSPGEDSRSHVLPYSALRRRPKKFFAIQVSKPYPMTPLQMASWWCVAMMSRSAESEEVKSSDVKRLREFVEQLELLMECAGTTSTRSAARCRAE